MNHDAFLVGLVDELEKIAGTALVGPIRPGAGAGIKQGQYRRTPVRAALRRAGKWMNLKDRETHLLSVLSKARRRPSTLGNEPFRHATRLKMLAERVQGAKGLRSLAKLIAVLVGVPTGISVAASHLRRKEKE